MQLDVCLRALLSCCTHSANRLIPEVQNTYVAVIRESHVSRKE